MTMKKKLLTTLSVVLILGLAALGILAYLTDTAENVNVMTLGNVSIEQHEYQRATNDDGTYKTDTIDNQTSYVLEDFDQGKALLPSAINTTTWEGWDWDTTTTVRMSQVGSYGGMQVFKEASNAQDKFVVVKNTGKTDAYVRTLVAIEAGSTDGLLVGSSYHSNWNKNNVGIVEIDGNNYYVYEYIYKGAQNGDGSWLRHANGVLTAGDTAYPNLSQVYIKSEATNEDCAAIDGNGNGTLDILVLSQAVQAEGFDTAAAALTAGFGEATVANVQAWFNGTKIPGIVYTAEEAQAALDNAKAGDVIKLAPGVDYGTLYFRANPDHSNTTLEDIADAYRYNYNRSIENITVVGAYGATVDAIVFETGALPGDQNNRVTVKNLVIDGIEFTDELTVGTYGYNAPIFIVTSNATVDGLTVKNCKLIGDNSKLNLVYLYGADGSKNVTISGNTVEGIARLCELRGTENVTITDNTIKDTAEHGILLAGYGYGGDVTITGNTADGINDRFVRMSGAENANVVIRNNTITNYSGKDEDYIKVTDAEGIVINESKVIENNTKN